MLRCSRWYRLVIFHFFYFLNVFPTDIVARRSPTDPRPGEGVFGGLDVAREPKAEGGQRALASSLVSPRGTASCISTSAARSRLRMTSYPSDLGFRRGRKSYEVETMRRRHYIPCERQQAALV
jgi:hypothetical protein